MYSFYNFQDAQNMDLISLLKWAVAGIICILFYFLYSYYGDVVNSECVSIGDIAYTALWYNYAIEHQKYVILIIARSQKPHYFNAFYMFPCSLANFAKVCSLNPV